MASVLVTLSIYPWLRSWKNQGIEWDDYPRLRGWFDEVSARPAVRRGVAVLEHLRKPVTEDRERDILFGSQQYERR